MNLFFFLNTIPNRILFSSVHPINIDPQHRHTLTLWFEYEKGNDERGEKEHTNEKLQSHHMISATHTLTRTQYIGFWSYAIPIAIFIILLVQPE